MYDDQLRFVHVDLRRRDVFENHSAEHFAYLHTRHRIAFIAPLRTDFEGIDFYIFDQLTQVFFDIFDVYRIVLVALYDFVNAKYIF